MPEGSLHRRAVIAGAAALTGAGASGPVEAACRAYETASRGRCGVHARNLASGSVVSWRPEERFVMCSTFKASLAALVPKRIEEGDERLDRPVALTAADLVGHAPAAAARLSVGWMSIEDLCRAAVEVSDNACANILLRETGGPAALTRFWRTCGDPVSRLDHNEPVLNRSPPGAAEDTTSPRAMAETLGRLALGPTLSGAGRERLSRWLRGCRTGADRLRAGLPANWTVGDKSGSNGADAAGDLAVARTPSGAALIMAVYAQGGRADPEAQLRLFRDVGRGIGQMLRSA